MGTTTNVIVVVLVLIGGYLFFGSNEQTESNMSNDIIIEEPVSVEEKERIIISCGGNKQLIGNECVDRDNQVNNPPDEPVLELDMSITELENEIERLINIEREKHGLRPLKSNALLREVAHGHSLDMAENSFFDHVNLDRQDQKHRGNEMGYICQATVPDPGVAGGFLIYSGVVAENLAMQPIISQAKYNDIKNGRVIWMGEEPAEEFLIENLPSSTVNGWMNSPGHRATILTAELIFGEIAIARSGNDFYITHNFAVCTP